MSAAVEMFPRTPPAARSCWYADSTFEPEEWLVRDLIPARSYSLLFAKYGSGKSFLAWHLACCGAAEMPFLGANLERFGTLYCVGEKGSRFGKRVAAWRQIFGEPNLAVRLRYAVPDLLDPGGVDDFISELRALQPEFEKRGAPLRLVVLDTLARSLKHASVSDQDTAGGAIEAIQRIVLECGVAVLPLAHIAKAEGSDSVKGAGEWSDAADTLLRIDRETGAKLRTLTVAKQSDGEDGKAYAFELEPVEIGSNEKGEPVWSCVVRDAEAPESGTKRPLKRLNAEAELALTALRRLYDAGQTAPVPFCPGLKPGSQGVRIAELRRSAYVLGLKKGEEPEAGSGEPEQKRWIEARKKAFQRALLALSEARLIRTEGDFVWIP